MPAQPAATDLGRIWETIRIALGPYQADEHDHAQQAVRTRVPIIGVDEIADRKGRKFLTVVADHDTGRVVFVGEGRNQHVFGEFLQSLGDAGREWIKAVAWT